jgi:hypothetical protein
MKKIIVIMICLLVLLSGCKKSNNTPDYSYGEAYVGKIELIIIGVDFQQILVKADEDEKEVKEAEEINENEEDMGIWYTIGDSTKMVNERNRKVGFYDLKVGSKVKVWGSNLQLLSNPPMTKASKLILIKQ